MFEGDPDRGQTGDRVNGHPDVVGCPDENQPSRPQNLDMAMSGMTKDELAASAPAAIAGLIGITPGHVLLQIIQTCKEKYGEDAPQCNSSRRREDEDETLYA